MGAGVSFHFQFEHDRGVYTAILQSRLTHYDPDWKLWAGSLVVESVLIITIKHITASYSKA